MSLKNLGNAARSTAKSVLRSLRTALVLGYDSLTLALSAKPPFTASPNPALIVRLDYIGDFLLWLPSARTLCKSLHAQGQRVVLVCNASVEELALKEGIFDEVIALDRKRFGLLRRQQTLLRFRIHPWSMVVNPTYSREPLFADSIVRAASSTRKIGFRGDSANAPGWAWWLSGQWYSDLVEKAPIHELEKNELMLQHMLASATAKPEYGPPICDPSTLQRFALPPKFAVLFPGVSWEGKKWPLDRFVAVGKHLQSRHGLPIVLLGAPNEWADAETIARGLNPAQTKNLAGQTSIGEMTAILSKAALLVSNDTSAVHIAAALRIPGVAVLGGGHFGRFLPYPSGARDLVPPLAAFHKMDCYGCAWNCVYPREAGAPVPCVEKVPMDDVISLVEKALKGA